MLTLTCKRAAALLSASLERGLPLGERLLLRLHLRACAACARYKAQLKLLRRALRRRARSLEEQGDTDLPALAPDARARSSWACGATHRAGRPGRKMTGRVEQPPV